jgi:hypothetical protein
MLSSPSRQLVAPACCRIASPCPLVVPRAALSTPLCAGWLLRHLSTRRPLVVSLSRHAASRCLVAPAGCRAIISSVLSLHRPLVLSLCWLVVALHVLAPPSCPLVVVHRPCHRTPSNAAAISDTSATTAIECRLYRPPLPQLPSIATVKCQRPPLSIAAVKR